MARAFLATFIFYLLLAICLSKSLENVAVGNESPLLDTSSLDRTLSVGERSSKLNSTDTLNNNNSYVNGTSTGIEGEGEGHRFPIFSIDFARIKIPMIISLWIFCAALGKIVFHMTPKLAHMFPESCMLVVIGLIIGGIFFYATPHAASRASPLTADTFFLYLLPPIVLDAGYFMPNRLFFDQLGTILVYAVLGTIWNTLTIGITLYALALTGMFGPAEDFPMLHVFLFSALISAVDPVAVLAVFEEIHVEEVLFILVFGESLLNDGVTVVLYHMFEGFNDIGEANIIFTDIVYGLISFLLVALGGTFIGIVWGFFTAFVTRFTHNVRVIEPIFIFIMSYLAYLNAELFHWSGILSITFCGITMKNYTEQNMSQKSQTTTKYAMKMLASSSETIIFLFLGVATVHGTLHHFNLWFIVITILLCSVYRVLGVLILTAMCNRFRVQKLDFVQKFILCYGGIRGAVAFALVITINAEHIPLAPTFVTTTIAVVFFTVFIQGITIKPLVEKLGVKKSDKRKLNMNERLHGRYIDYLMAGVEDVAGKFGNNYIRGWFKRIHTQHLQPLLVRNIQVKEPKLIETLSKLKMQDALNFISQKPVSLSDLESLSTVLQSNMYATNNHREWNLDVGEFEYKPGDRDINEAKFHHILSNEYQFYKGRRQSTYKRHAVRDDELQTQTDFHNQMVLRARQVAMTSIRNRGRLSMDSNGNAPIRAIQQQLNGSAVRLKHDYLEETLRDNPAFIDDEGIFSNSRKGSGDIPNTTAKRYSIKGPSIAETLLPWKRFTEDDAPTSNTKIRRSRSVTNDDVPVDLPPTMAEVILPWKRTQDEEYMENPFRQSEFPPWAVNQYYTEYYSPTNTFLGKIIGYPEKKPTMKEIFDKRHSSHSIHAARRGSLNDDEMPSLRSSAKDDIYSRRSSLKDDPSMHRRGSLIDFKELSQTRFSATPESLCPPEHHPDRRSSRESIGVPHESLMNTVIEEEEKPSPKNESKIKKDHVINIDPAAGGGRPKGEGEDTKF